MLIAGFDWDDGNREKCQKYGASITDIESVFAGSPGVGPDPFDVAAETRFRAIGRAESSRYVFVVFTLRAIDGELRVRPISARYMHANEVLYYDQQYSH